MSLPRRGVKVALESFKFEEQVRFLSPGHNTLVLGVKRAALETLNLRVPDRGR